MEGRVQKMFLKVIYEYIASWGKTWSCSQKTWMRQIKRKFQCKCIILHTDQTVPTLEGFSHLDGDFTLLPLRIKVEWVARTVWPDSCPPCQLPPQTGGPDSMCLSTSRCMKGSSLLLFWCLWDSDWIFKLMSFRWALGLSQCYNGVKLLEPLAREGMSCALART